MPRFITEIRRQLVPLAILIVGMYFWGFEDTLKTLSLLGVFISSALILGHFVGKSLFGKYDWDVGARLNMAWRNQILSDSILAVGVLFARMLIYIAILFAMVFLAGTLLRGSAMGAECPQCHTGVPNAAWKSFDVLRQEHSLIWPDSDINIIAGQIQAESNWRMTATRREASGVTSYGGLQVLDVTWADLKEKNQTLLSGDPTRMLQAQWGIRAGILYDKKMWGLCDFAASKQDRYAFTLASYNGGYGWILRDRKITAEKGKDKNVWFNNVALYSSRSKQNFRINREYPINIFKYSERYKGVL